MRANTASARLALDYRPVFVWCHTAALENYTQGSQGDTVVSKKTRRCRFSQVWWAAHTGRRRAGPWVVQVEAATAQASGMVVHTAYVDGHCRPFKERQLVRRRQSDESRNRPPHKSYSDMMRRIEQPSFLLMPPFPNRQIVFPHTISKDACKCASRLDGSEYRGLLAVALSKGR